MKKNLLSKLLRIASVGMIVAFTFLLNACKKEESQFVTDEKTPGAATQNPELPNSTSSKSDNAGNVWVDFNSNAYANEFWTEPGKAYGSCFAAAVVLVESHLNLLTSISNDAVKNKNNQMKGTTLPTKSGVVNGITRYFYVLSLQDIINRLTTDGFTVTNKVTTGRTTARDAIINGLKNNEWPIALAGYLGGGIGHAYPIYAVNVIKNSNGTINEASSIIKVIDSFDGSWQPYSTFPIWINSPMYKQVSLSTFLDRMRTNTAGTTIYNYYNIITVKK